MNITRKIKISKNKVGITIMDQIRLPNKRPRIKHYELATEWNYPKKKLHRIDVAV